MTGGSIGLIGTAFRFLLSETERLRESLIVQSHEWAGYGLLLSVAGVAIAAGLARWLVVRFAPSAAGSGVQYVEAEARGEAEPSGPEIIPIKFIGGLLAIGSGLALGREGPTVQMGAAIGTISAHRLLPDAADRIALNVAGAGAGLAVAFNAPIGGAVFVFEELTGRFTSRLMLATLAAGTLAIVVLRVFLGDQQDFAAGQAEPASHMFVFLAFGAVIGLIGALYNVLTCSLLQLADALPAIPSVAKAAAIGGVIGLVAWFWPGIVGGGDNLTQGVLSNQFAVGELALIFVVRFLIGPFSYAAGTPGGLFAPLLVVGAAFGALFAGVGAAFIPGQFVAVNFAVVGMAALFTAIVRAPLTGITLIIEMTGRADLVLAMMTASLGVLLVTSLCGSEPIYDSLRQRMLAEGRHTSQDPSR